MTSTTDFDRLVESWLETAGPPDVIDDVVTAAFIETRTLTQRRAPWPIGPRSWPAAGTTAALPWRTILVAAALVAALAAALALVAGGTPPSPLGTTGNVAIVLRQPEGAADTVDVIAVAADGTQRLVRRFGPGDLGGRRVLPYGEVSLDGWFALALGEDNAASGTFALLRLDDPSRPPVFVDYQPYIGGAWSPTGGRFAFPTGASIAVIDANTGRVQDFGSLSLPGGGPSLLWAADGSGIMVQADTGLAAARPLGGRLLLTQPPAIWWPTGERFARPGASSEPSIQREVDGSPLMTSSFSADGMAAWGLYDEDREGQDTAVLARGDGVEPAQVVARVPLGEDVTQLWFAALDRADTRIAIGSWVGEDAVLQPIRIVETATGRVTSVEGNLIGFVPPTSLDGPEEAAPSLAAPGPSSSSSSPAPTVQLREYAGVFEPVLPGVDGMLGYPPTVTGLGDGRVLALADGQLQVFDPATDRLTTTGRTVAHRTTGAALVPLSDGLVLITGGDSAAFPDETGDAALGSATAEILDPATGLSSPVGGVAAPWGFAAARLANGNVLVAGGTVNVAAGEESPALAVASVFDPATRRFADVGNMVIPRAGHRIVPLLDGGALVVGGAQDATAERYDPATGTFTVTGAMSDPGVATAVRLLDGRVLVIHGWCSELQPMDRDGFGTGYRPVSTEIFDPSSGRFAPSADLPHCVSSATLLPNGEVLVEGFWGEGRNTRQRANLVAPGTAWSGRFDPVTGRIVETAAPDRYRAAPALLPDGSVLFVGGNAFSDALPSWATRYR